MGNLSQVSPRKAGGGWSNIPDFSSSRLSYLNVVNFHFKDSFQFWLTHFHPARNKRKSDLFFYRKSVNVSLTFLKATNTLVEIYFVTVMLYEYSRGLDIAFKVHEFNVMPFCQIYLEVFPIRPG